jgi:hypothetical protein
MSNTPEIPDFADLSPLERVDPAAFQSADVHEQEVCNFVLALAVVYNDFKDLLWAANNWKKCAPQNAQTLTPQGGQWAGMNFHVTKLIHALIYELCELIRAGELCRNHLAFKKTLDSVNAKNRTHWENLIDFANGNPGNDDLMMLLVRLRNNLAFHYDSKVIARGYMTFFAERTLSGRDAAYVSRGNSLKDSRFYFADAAIQGAYKNLESQGDANIPDRIEGIAQSLNRALYDIVESFVEARGFGWTKYRP